MSLDLYGHQKKWRHHQLIPHLIQNIGQGIEIDAHILIAIITSFIGSFQICAKFVIS